MTVQGKAELVTNAAAARPTKINNQVGLENSLLDDIIDTVLADQQLKIATPYAVVNLTDSGKVFGSALDAMVFQLPAIVIGNTMTFINLADDGDAAINVSPDSNDGITYAGSSTDDKDLRNTKTTAKKGDFVTIAALNATVTWQVTAARGIWAKVG